jgi:multisubunit Na+/H+ antiporter MnhG subunit
VAFWNKLNANERLAGIGAIVVIVGFIVSLLGSYGFGANTLVLLGAIAVLVIYYLKYSPTQTNMTWPAPIPTIVLAISAIAALLAILGVLPALGLLGGLGLYTLGAILTVIGAVIMVWGAWQEYQAMPKATPPTGGPQL